MRKYGMIMDMRMIAPTICDAVAVSILRESENAGFILVRNDSRKDFDAQALTANQIIHSINIFRFVSENSGDRNLSKHTFGKTIHNAA